jgi:lipopolysaccharide transport system ATP-binding protein
MMNGDYVIRAEDIGKRYLINHNLKDSSFLKTFSSRVKGLMKGSSAEREEFWALRGVSFDIKKGDRVGIIGRNGAGKSTLLKILSRIVKPTTGRIEYHGRMSSLLEVGTGFHSDLTGRENIYLNGSILGMNRFEIDRKFDEIVAFSEVEQFLDTPVKRYSSGMYVRLAFAVAAHLEPDILIVDEVLAVGDAAFQKKSVGKMQEASEKEGRTILFVSHNMGQIATLCNRAVLLNAGVTEMDGSVQSVIRQYFNTGGSEEATDMSYPHQETSEYYISHIRIRSAKGEPVRNFGHNEAFVIDTEIVCNRSLPDVIVGLSVSDLLDRKIFTTQYALSGKIEVGHNKTFSVTIPPDVLTPNNYRFSVALHIPNIQLIDEKVNAGTFAIYDNGSEFFKYSNVDIGMVFVKAEWGC